MKQIKGSRWAPELRCWHIPYTTGAWDSLKTVFADYEIVKSEAELAPQKQTAKQASSEHAQSGTSATALQSPSIVLENHSKTLKLSIAPQAIGSKGHPPGLPNARISRPEHALGISQCPDSPDYLSLHVPFHLVSEHLAVVKNIHGRRWNMEQKVWEVPYTKLTLRFFEQYFPANLLQ